MNSFHSKDNDPSVSNQTHENRMKKRVRFTQANVKEIGRYSSEDNASCWYTKRDLQKMRDDVKIQAKSYRKCLNIDLLNNVHMSSLVMPYRNSGIDNNMRVLCKSHTSFRGLESRIFSEKKRNITIATRTVLEFQRRTEEILKTANIPDTDVEAMKRSFRNRLSTICSQLSKWSRDEAYATARYDESGIYSSSSSIRVDMTSIEIRKRKKSMKREGNNGTIASKHNSKKRRSRSTTSGTSQLPRSVSPSSIEDLVGLERDSKKAKLI